ncbi:MAG: transposase [Rhizobiales bacterium]|nr:transposase [Hyphomicrobiales bacterium]
MVAITVWKALLNMEFQSRLPNGTSMPVGSGRPHHQTFFVLGIPFRSKIRTAARLPRETLLPDGSYLSRIYACERDRRHKTGGVAVRVVDYRLDGVTGAEPLYRLVTTIFDPTVSAEDLAALYHERWEIETALDELKTHLRGARIVLRSKTPDLVRQEFHGLMMAHFAVRNIIHDAALRADEDPDRLSFLHAVRVIRRKRSAFVALPPCGQASLP